MEALTIEGLGADLAVRSGHSTAMTRGGNRVTLHALHGLPPVPLQVTKPLKLPHCPLQETSPQN